MTGNTSFRSAAISDLVAGAAATRIIGRSEIEKVLPTIDLLAAMEKAFIAYSDGSATVPPVAELLFEKPPGEAHIKYGYVEGDDFFVIKIATGFYENAVKGLAPFSGILIAFNRNTGQPAAVLLDEGLLTNIRTAAAGALVAQLLARSDLERIAVLGCGTQAHLQLEMLRRIFPQRHVTVWARRADGASDLARAAGTWGFSATTAASPAEAVANANLIVTATASTAPLIAARDIKSGTHITAIGSDTPHKHELSYDVLELADVVVADSISQCRIRGELHHALRDGLDPSRILELGNILSGRSRGRNDANEITVADLTGVAVQDIAMVNAVLAHATCI